MPSQIVRILCEARSASRTVRDTVTGERPFLWRGSSLTFQLGLTDNGQHLLRAGVGTIIVEVKRLDATSADDALMRKEFVAADCDATFTAADWTGGAKQLLAATFTVAEAALYPGSYRLIVRHEGTDGTALTHLSAEFAVLDPQSGSEGIDAPPVAWSYLEALPVVRTDIVQSLSDPQKAQARANIGAGETTAAAIVTALSTATPKQDSDILASLGAERGTASVRGLSNTLRLLANRGAATSIIGFGDSFAAGMPSPLGLKRHARVVGAYRCGQATGELYAHTAINVSSASQAANVVTINLASAHDWPVGSTGQVAVAGITGFTGPNPNATVTATMTSATQLTYALVGAAGTYNGAAATVTQLGAATVIDYTKSPDGRVWYLKANGQLSCGNLTSGGSGPANRVYYTLFPGTGTAQLQYREGAGAWTNVGSPIDTTAISTVLIGAAALPAMIQDVTCRVVATGGTVLGWIGQGLDGPGITAMNFSFGGFEAVQNLDISETLWKAMVSGYKASGGAQIIATHYGDYRFANQASTVWAKGVDYYGPSGPWSTFRAWSKAANPDCDWLIVGAHPVDPARVDGADAVLDPLFAADGVGQLTNDRIAYTVSYARQWAIANGEAFVDCFNWTTYAVGNAAGYYADTIHMSAEGNTMKAARIVAESGLRHVMATNVGKSVKVGSVSINEMPIRTSTTFSGVGFYDENGQSHYPALLYGIGFRAVNPTRPEEQGIEWACVSTNVGELRTYGPGGAPTSMLRFEIGIPYPNTNGTGSVGKAANRFSIGYTNAVATGYREISSAYTIAAGDHTINVLSGTFDITLPVSFSGGVNAGESGRELIICNNGAGTVTIRTVSDGANLQKIDNATTLVLAAGQKARLKSAGFHTSTDYRNWITV